MRRSDLHIGHYVSGAGHLTVIGWLLLGNFFTSEPPPFEMTEVSVISGSDFDALIAAQQPPDTATEVAQPDAPEVTPDAPEVVAEPDAEVEQPAPEQAEPPADDTPPEVAEQSLPPQADVTDTPPTLDEPVGDQAVLVPEVAPEAAPRPVERVAPEPVAQPEPEATPDPVEQEAVAPDETGDAPQETQEATAPEEATTEIVTEATKAPAASPRPPGRRPSAPQVAQTPVETPTETPRVAETPAPTETPDTDVDADAIAAAVAAAQEATEAPAPPAPSGPPLTAGEKENLRVAVSNCWNVGSLSSEALRTTVVVTVNMAQDATPIISSIQMAGSEGGSPAAAKQAFEAARRAIILCGSKGYQLPAEKYSQWQEIEMTFNPERMRVK
ncbi:energy transducer TonB [Sulfitobacter sp. THAF37]|uniref:energy transducer TonB n=1 Tax=Sulfitobacter sp. THAF37 TaxID=2587855 RepID=UPI0012679F64|nr:energy transducer TonB [Sulfitobacter sp. THAF37]